MTNWPADAVERRAICELNPAARNARTHSDAQVSQIVASMQQFGWTIPILVDEKDNIVAGHGRLLAAQKLGFAECPVMVARGWTEAQKRAYAIADNKLTLNGGWDTDLLKLELIELSNLGFDLELTGFSLEEIKGLETPQNPYTNKIAAPIYEPTGPCPPISQLLDRSKTEQLIDEITAADLPFDIAEFLKFAAERHATFNFAAIANYYAHADEKTQSLMQRSALVIIDFDSALENGFARLSQAIDEQYEEDYGGRADAA